MATWLPKFHELICDQFTPFHEDYSPIPCTLISYINLRGYVAVPDDAPANEQVVFRAIEMGSPALNVPIKCVWYTNELSPCGNKFLGSPIIGIPTTDTASMNSVVLTINGIEYYAKQTDTQSGIPALRAHVNQTDLLVTMPKEQNVLGLTFNTDPSYIGNFSDTILSRPPSLTDGFLKVVPWVRAPLHASETSYVGIRTGPTFALVHYARQELKTEDVLDPVRGDVKDIIRSPRPHGWIDISLADDVTLDSPIWYPKPTFGRDYIRFAANITRDSATGYSPIDTDTAGIQIIDVGGDKTLLSLTGLETGSPFDIAYRERITVDNDVTSQLTVASLNAPTFGDLLFYMNLSFANAVATLEDGNIVLRSNKLGPGSSVLTLPNIFADELFSSLNGYVENQTPIDGEEPQPLDMKYSIDFNEPINGFTTIDYDTGIFFGYEAQTIGELMDIIDHAAVTVSIDNAGDRIKIESLSVGSGSQVIVSEDSLIFPPDDIGSPIILFAGSPNGVTQTWYQYPLSNYVSVGCAGSPVEISPYSCDGHTYSLTINLDDPITSSTLVRTEPDKITTYAELIDIINVELGSCNPPIVELLDSRTIRITSPSFGVTSVAKIHGSPPDWDIFEELQNGSPPLLFVGSPPFPDIIGSPPFMTLGSPIYGIDPITDEGYEIIQDEGGPPYIKAYAGSPNGWVIFDSSIPSPTLYDPAGSPLPDCGSPPI